MLFNLNSPPAKLYKIDRGGGVTHHLPGQLVGYLVLDLQRYKTDLHWYLYQLEGIVLDVLEELNLPGERVSGLTGVWCKGLKVASIGVGCRRWITQHGLALNVNCELEGFNEILPCGLNGSVVGKLENWIPGITVGEVQPLVKKYLRKRFGLNLHEAKL